MHAQSGERVLSNGRSGGQKRADGGTRTGRQGGKEGPRPARKGGKKPVKKRGQARRAAAVKSVADGRPAAQSVKRSVKAGVSAARRGKGRRTAEREADARRVLRAALPALGASAGEGLGAVAAIAEGAGGPWDVAWTVADQTRRLAGGRAEDGAGGAVKLAKRYASRSRVRAVADLLAALGSVHRVKLMAKLLEGPATYQALRKATGLLAGPLYHHIAQLRLAGLIRPKERDLYDLTCGGRNVLLVALALPGLAKDARARPQPPVDSR